MFDGQGGAVHACDMHACVHACEAVRFRGGVELKHTPCGLWSVSDALTRMPARALSF